MPVHYEEIGSGMKFILRTIHLIFNYYLSK